MTFSGPIEDQLGIRSRFDAYSDATCRQDLDAYLSCWAPDGARLGQGGEAHGIDELREHWAGIWQMLAQMVFITQIGAIEVDGDTAHTRSYCLEILRLQNGGKHRLVGEYVDRLVRVDGEWLFHERRYRVLMDDV
jgi:ketosteroid isomerase-like protein